MTSLYETPTELLAIESISMLTRDLSEADRETALRDIIEKARQEIHEGRLKQAAFVVTLGHERLGTRRIGLEAPDNQSDMASLDEIVLILIESATRQASKDTINADSYDNEDDYDLAVDRRSRTFHILDVQRKKETERWIVRGSTRDALFENEIHAATASDAGFQARWDNAIAIHGPITRDAAQGFLTHVQEIEIKETILNPVTLMELYASISDAFGKDDQPSTWNGEIKNGEAWERVKKQIEKLKGLAEKPADQSSR